MGRSPWDREAICRDIYIAGAWQFQEMTGNFSWAGIDMALRVVARYCGVEVARATARHMEYPYSEDNKRRVEWPIPSPTEMP